MEATHIEIGLMTIYTTPSGTLKPRTTGKMFPLVEIIGGQDRETIFSASRFFSAIHRTILTTEGAAEMAACLNAEHEGDGVAYYRFVEAK